MCPLIVSEKTLELNICAEMLGLIRSLPNCQAAFWIGMKQDQEARNGLDELISNLPAGQHLLLQFKAPWSRPPNTVPYKFTISDRQNGNLLRLAARRPDAVYYVFPHYNTFTQMRSNSPVLLSDTHLLKVEDLRHLPFSTNRLGTHLVETSPPVAIIHSELIEAKLTLPSDTLRSIFDAEKSTLHFRLIPHTWLKEWLGELIREAEGNRRAIGQRLKGFSTFCIT
jgi:hypothetical protein